MLLHNSTASPNIKLVVFVVVIGLIHGSVDVGIQSGLRLHII